MPLDENILSQTFGKDKRGRTRSVRTIIPKTQVKAYTIPRKHLRRSKQDSNRLETSMEKVEGSLENVMGTLNTLVDILKGYVKQMPDIASNEGGSGGTHHESVGRTSNNDDAANPLISHVQENQKCEVLNFDLEVIATGFVCRDSTASIIHGKPVPPTHEKLIVNNILLPDEPTTKQNHPLAMIFDDVGIGGYVCHPKSSIRYL